MKKSFKRLQKEVNKYVRDFNKALEEDKAFLGRIYIRQYSCGFIEYSDGSGAMWYGVLRIYDKETNTYKSVCCSISKPGDSYSFKCALSMGVNNFVVDDLDIDIHRAIALGVDYRRVKHNPRKATPFHDSYDMNYSYKRYEL